MYVIQHCHFVYYNVFFHTYGAIIICHLNVSFTLNIIVGKCDNAIMLFGFSLLVFCLHLHVCYDYLSSICVLYNIKACKCDIM